MIDSPNNINEYINYFRWLAIGQQDLKHDPDSELEDADEGTCHFTKISVEEVLTKLRSKIGWPLLSIELYETIFQSEIVYDIKMKPRGAFMVLDNPADKSDFAKQVAYSNSETIMYQLLQQIWTDMYGYKKDRCPCQTPFKEFEFDKLQIIPVGPLFSGQYGWRCEFSLEFQKRINIAQAPPSGSFAFPLPVQDGSNDLLTDGNGSTITTITDVTPTP